jgi:hypothetical protein
VGGIALEHRGNANWVFRWRRAKREHKRVAGTVRQTVLLPVTVDPQESLLAAAPGGHALVAKEGAIKIKIGGAHVVLRGRIDPASVHRRPDGTSGEGMIGLHSGTPIWLAAGMTQMRRGLDGLAPCGVHRVTLRKKCRTAKKTCIPFGRLLPSFWHWQ